MEVNMKACGLIVEYNPFHNGHLYHVNESRKLSNADCIIAVMSGNFLQRGEPAIVDKWARTKMALQNGVDLVIELPYPYAVQHSEIFAEGAIAILNSLHTDYVCFGSEHGNIDDFIQIEKWIQQNEESYSKKLKEYLRSGDAYPKAHEKALSAVQKKDKDIDLSQPNNILGRQYVRQILNQKASITPLTIQRISNHYHDQKISSPIASATSIRQAISQSGDWNASIQTTVPSVTEINMKEYFQETNSWHLWEKYFPYLLHRILTSSMDELRVIHDVKEGLENRIYQAAEEATSFKSLMEKVKTKRYTWTSLQRIFTHILTNSTKQEMQALRNKQPEIRILGMNQTGRNYLSFIKTKDEHLSFYTSSKPPYRYYELVRKVNHAYYSILSPEQHQHRYQLEFRAPILLMEKE